MIITPAKFEDEMRRIAERRDMSGAIALMLTTLRSMGYEAGVRIFEEEDKHEDRAD